MCESANPRLKAWVINTRNPTIHKLSLRSCRGDQPPNSIYFFTLLNATASRSSGGCARRNSLRSTTNKTSERDPVCNIINILYSNIQCERTRQSTLNYAHCHCFVVSSRWTQAVFSFYVYVMHPFCSTKLNKFAHNICCKCLRDR